MDECLVALPSCYASRPDGVLDVLEEEGTTWLWALRESLVDWPRPIEWIRAPAVSDGTQPGDLWGVDKAGELLLVEAKRGPLANPFRRFEGFAHNTATNMKSEDLLAQWQTDLAEEMNADDCLRERPPGGRKTGLIPSSSRRFAVKRWPDLSRGACRHLRSTDYERSVRESLEARRAAGNTAPHLIGLIVQTTSREPGLTAKGNGDARWLRGKVGGRLHLYGVRAERMRETVRLRLSPIALPDM